MSESEAISLAQTGDAEAFSVLYAMHKQTVHSCCYKILKSPEEAEDATQDVFLTVYQKIPQFRSASSFRTWVYRMACNKSLEYLRRRKTRPFAYTDEIPDVAIMPDQQQRVEWEEILNTLNPQQQLLLTQTAAGYKKRELGTKACITHRLKKIRAGLREQLV